MYRSFNSLFFSDSKTIHKKNDVLFEFIDESKIPVWQYEQKDMEFFVEYFSSNFDYSYLDGAARIICELSYGAFDILVYAWLSELPIEGAIAAFGKNILAAVQSAGCLEEKRRLAWQAAQDRGDPNTLTVLSAAGKAAHEAHKMMGFLRFLPNKNGEFIAKCEPDHFVLPAFGDCFTARFGETAWSIIDEKRQLCLRRLPQGSVKIMKINPAETSCVESDEWESLWKHYHQTINNEDRNNPNLQRQFMPKRYWKYLPEM